jgi:hypothetical protein
MEAWAEWLYRREPRYFIVIMQALGVVLVLIALGPPSLLIMPSLFDFSAGETALVFGSVVGVTVAATVVASALSRTLRGPLTAWGRGDRRDPMLVWRCGTRLTKQLSTRIILVALVLALPVNVVLIRYVLDRSWVVVVGFHGAFVAVAGRSPSSSSWSSSHCFDQCGT